jgi:branched-chain amino acid transport system ATP-binding protein
VTTGATTQSGTAGGQPAAPGRALLSVTNVEVIYDEVILVLRGLSMKVPEGSIVALLGSNGAGKSTTLKAVSGLLPSERGEITDGEITFDGRDITRMDAAERVRTGLSLCMEGRHVFEHLTVHENLVAGAYARRGAKDEDFDLVYTYFPILAGMRSRVAGYLSGGEQQMLAIGRALMRNPDLILMDEPSEGLSPRLVEHVGEIMLTLKKRNHSILLVEQNIGLALSVADYVHVLSVGKFVFEGRPEDLSNNAEIINRHLGVAGSEPVA